MDYSIPQFNFESMLAGFSTEVKKWKRLSKKSLSSYCTYLTKLNSANSDMTIDWIKEAIVNCKDFNNRKDYLDNKLRMFLNSHLTSITPYTANDITSAFRLFVEYVLSYFNSQSAISWANLIDDLTLAKLIAQTAIFVPTTIVKDVKAGKIGTKQNLSIGNSNASWDNGFSLRDVGNVGKIINGKLCDDNSRPNRFLKDAIMRGMSWGKNRITSAFQDFQVCHVYDASQFPDYYTSMMNLILVPRSLAALTDYNHYVKEVLKYRIYELYDFFDGSTPPTMPKNYSKIIWR